MNLSIPLTEFWYIVGGVILGFTTRDVFPWIFREALKQRKDREEWYKKVSRLAGDAHSAFDSQFYDAELVEEDKMRLLEIEKELNKLTINTHSLDEEIERNAKQLRIDIEILLNRDLVKHLPDDGLALESDMDLEELEIINDIKDNSFELHQKSATEAKNTRGKIPFIKTRI
jgi:hypothetical protein